MLWRDASEQGETGTGCFFIVDDGCLCVLLCDGYLFVFSCRCLPFSFSYSMSADCLLLVVSFAHTVQDD